MGDRIERVRSGALWESVAGYCRAVRVGERVWVSGTTSIGPDGEVWAPRDAGAQTKRCFAIIEEALASFGDAMIVRTRMYVTDISRWEEIARAHGECVGERAPAATRVEVSRLIGDELLGATLECDSERTLARRSGSCNLGEAYLISVD